MPKAVIVGAGINGLCTARSLLRRGWEVEVVDRGPIPNPEAASFDRHRLIRAQYGDPGYAARLPAAFAAWEALWRDVGQRHYVETGVLALSRAPGDWTDRGRPGLDAAGAEVETLSAPEVAARWPMLETGGVRYGLLARQGGALLADRILADLAGWLAGQGARLRPHAPIQTLDAEDGAVEGPFGRIAGDVVILAAGVGLPALAPGLAADLVPRRVVVVYARPPERWASAWEGAPCWVDLGGEDDLWGFPPLPGLAMKLGAGGPTRPGDPEAERAVRAEDAAAVLAAYRGRFRDAEGYAAEKAVVNFYLMAPEERFVLRRTGRALLLSADSGHGFKFGPLTGEDVADALAPGGFEPATRRLAGRG
jgi:sarcosine oxidase